MAARQITADGIAAGDRLNLAGAEFTVTARVHGAWYLDCPHARWVEFELIPTGGLPRGPQRADRAPAAQRHVGHRGPLRSRLGGRSPPHRVSSRRRLGNLPATSASLVA